MHYFGIDVSKDKLDCCWLFDQQHSKFKTKTVKNSSTGINTLFKWIKRATDTDNDQVHIILEATSIYHLNVATTLFLKGYRIHVVNPLRAKRFAESLGNTHKTDARDSLNLARYGQQNQLPIWQPEVPEVRILKSLLTRLEALEIDLQREHNRLEKSVFEDASKRVIESLKLMIRHIEDEKKRLEKDIDDHIQSDPNLKKNRQLLMTIPGIGAVVSRVLLPIIHANKFNNARQVAAYLGLIPKQNESGVFKGKSRLTKTGPAKVRAKLYMAAVVSLRANPDIRRQYERLLANGKSKMQALGAAMRKLVQICFGVLKHQKEYQPRAA